MINVQQITSTLAQMSDQALQQYAQANKEDPYALALSVSESTRRKDLRNAAQAQQGQPAPGTVADEAVMGMAPPPPVAGLSAVAPQGYADGGGVDMYTMPELQRDPRLAALLSGRSGSAADEEMRLMPAFWRALAEGKTVDQIRAEQNEGLPSMRPLPEQGPDTGDETDRLLARYPAPGTAAPTGQAAATPAAGLGGAANAVLPQLARPDGAGGARSSTSSTTRGTAAGSPKMDLDYAGLESAAKARIAPVTAAKQKAAETEAAALEKAQAERGVYGKDREDRIKNEQAQLDGKGEQARKMALMQAGFAILSADPSKGAFSAIGTGALQGLQSYKGDMADIAKQRTALVDKLDQIDDLRRQEATADGRELRAIRAKIAQAEIEGAEALAAVGTKIDLEVRPQAQIAAFKELSANYRQQQDNAAKIAAARISASGGSRNTQDELIRNYAASAKIPYHQAAQEIASGKQRPQGAVDPMENFNNWLKATPMAATMDPQQAMKTYLATTGALNAVRNIRQTDAPEGPLLAR